MSVAFSPDGRMLASGGSVRFHVNDNFETSVVDVDFTVRLWDVISGAHKMILTGHTKSVMSVAFSPDGGTVASASADKTIRLWDSATGAHKRTFTGHGDVVRSVAFSPDGGTLASGSDDGTILLWDVSGE